MGEVVFCCSPFLVKEFTGHECKEILFTYANPHQRVDRIKSEEDVSGLSPLLIKESAGLFKVFHIFGHGSCSLPVASVSPLEPEQPVDIVCFADGIGIP